ncbi:hypothetical protein BG006_010698 [Podila minutissima]|uniref:Uncharacterized protein n=1 Tax=Podila minutissima TaxID=64525 RepID=A0A9P5SFP4_9FUNG|nr:hypothetical protein BG006_010698 [Podila minutissima]
MDLYIPSSLLKDKHSVLHNTPYSSSVPQPESNIRHRVSKHTSHTGNYHLAEQEEQFDQPNSEDEAEEREYQQAKKQRAMAKQLKTEAKERQRDEKKARKLMDKEAKLLRQKSKRRQSVVRMSYQSNNSTTVNAIPDTNGPNSEKASEASAILTLASSEQGQITECNQPEMGRSQSGERKPENDRIKSKGYFKQIWAKIRHQRSPAHSSKKGKQVQDYWGTEKKSHESTTTSMQGEHSIKSIISPPISPPLHKSDSRHTNISTTTGTTTTSASLSLRNSLQMSHRNSSLSEQETTRTWRGLFAAVRQLSHSASTTGSSHMSSSSSSATSVSSLSVSAQPPRLPNLLLAEPLPQSLSADRPKSPPVPARPHGHKRQGSTLPPRHFQHRRQRSANARKVSIVLIGDGAVGKSAMALRFLRDQFNDEYDPTIEDSYCKHVEVDGQEYTLEITDTAGQEEYRGQWNENFMKAADGFICIYSIESLSSFKELVGMRDQIWQTKESQNVPMIVAANKCDLESAREVTVEAGKAFAAESHAFFAETSAKTGFNIQEMVVELVRAVAKNSGRHHEADKMFKESHHKECTAAGAGGMLSPHSAVCTGNGCCRVM